MDHDILAAKEKLEADGLNVKPSSGASLIITATSKDAGGGLRLSRDASALVRRGQRWVAIFPSSGTLSYEVPGVLPGLVELIRGVYKHFRRNGGPFNEAFERSVPDSESYLVGRFACEDQLPILPPLRHFEIGTDEGLKFRIEWSESPEASVNSGLSRGRAYLWIGGNLVWGDRAGTCLVPVERNWVVLLDSLSREWSYVKLEERYPLGLQPRDPSLLRSDAETRWEMQAEGLAIEEEKEVVAFERRHDLTQGFSGVNTLPHVRLIREGNQMWISSMHFTVLRPLAEVLDQLSAIGDAISNRIIGSDAPPFPDIAGRWQRRDKDRSSFELARIATGFPAETLRQLERMVPSEQLALDSQEGSFQLTEILAAARMMIGSLKPAAVQVAISAIAGSPKVSTVGIDRLSDEAEGVLFNRRLSRAFEQGYILANWFRTRLDIKDSLPVNPEKLLDQLGVNVTNLDIPDDRLDALACWGPKHGPIVMINKLGRHSQTLPGRNATLAHELCHILIDREGALPLAEALNGHAPWRVEARARAFAAELLLPRKRAEEVSRASLDITTAVEALRSEYGVSLEIAVRQIDNARPSLSPQKAEELKLMVSSLGQF